MSTHSKVIAGTDRHTHTHTQTDTHTHTTKTLPLPHTREVKKIKNNNLVYFTDISCKETREV